MHSVCYIYIIRDQEEAQDLRFTSVRIKLFPFRLSLTPSSLPPSCTSTQTTLELVNAIVPPRWMQPSRAPPPPHPPICFVTGLPARYVDPQTRSHLANTLAFKRLRGGAGPLAPALQQQLVLHHHMEQVGCG